MFAISFCPLFRTHRRTRVSCSVCINAYSKRIRDQIPANKRWPVHFLYANRDAAADNADNPRPMKVVLCVKTKAGPPSLGSVRLIMADYWRTWRNRRARRLSGVGGEASAASVDGGLRGK